MSPANAPLKSFEQNHTSQFGEDGVIARALELIGHRDRWCVEFGAWDGKYASNTFSLIDRAGYSAVLIEADADKFVELQATHVTRPNVLPVRRFVEFEGINTLDRILAESPIPHDFDVLSIDIDGNDYHIWDSLRTYRPKLVVIEYNPTIPNEVDFVQPRDMHVTQGCSLAALCRLARTKHYRLVHATVCNGIFVRDEYFPRFGIADDSPECLRTDLSTVTYLFQTFDGKVHLTGNKQLLWHGLPLEAARFQAVPGLLQSYPPNYSRFQRLCWRAFNRMRKWKKRLVPYQR